MKWIVIDQKDLPIQMRNKKFFRLIPTQRRFPGTEKDFDKNLPKILEQLLGEPFEPWVTFNDLPKLEKIAKRKYEIFCGGFLYYHDVEFKNYPMNPKKQYPPGKTGYDHNKFEHKIFFEWMPKTKGKEKLRVYINSTPTQFNTNPPPPPKPPPPES